MADTGSVGLDTPAITKEDVTAIIAVVATVASLFGMDITAAQQAGLSAGLMALLGVGLLLAGAIRRHGRAKVAAAAITAGSDPGAILKALPNPTPQAGEPVPSGADFTNPTSEGAA